jgi:hypothetical protein
MEAVGPTVGGWDYPCWMGAGVMTGLLLLHNNQAKRDVHKATGKSAVHLTVS